VTTERRKVQRFLLDGDVEVTIKFPPGAARWQSTQSAVSIATGETDVLPSIGHALNPVSAGVSVPTSNGPLHDTPEIVAARERLNARRPMTSADAFANAGLDGAGVGELEAGLLGAVDA
jgi:hypothetical protein